MTGHTNQVTSVAYSPDGHTLASGSADDGTHAAVESRHGTDPAGPHRNGEKCGVQPRWAHPGLRRVASQALGGEVLVSNLVRELVADADVEFLESREVALKGLEGSHRLFAVALD